MYMHVCSSTRVLVHRKISEEKMSFSNSVVDVDTDDLFGFYVDNFLFGFYIGEKNVFVLATLLCMY